MESDQVEELKMKINNFIWMNAPSEMTLEEADKAAFDLLVAMIPSEARDDT